MRYALSDNSSVWLGYTWVPTFPRNGESFDEHRIWEQFLWSGQTPLGLFTTRSRMEHRFVEIGSNVGWRLRQLLRLSWPLATELPVNFILWDEVFVHINSTDWGVNSGFDQNRGFVGFGYAFDERFRTEFGYLNQFISTDSDDRMNHILFLTFLANF